MAPKTAASDEGAHVVTQDIVPQFLVKPETPRRAGLMPHGITGEPVVEKLPALLSCLVEHRLQGGNIHVSFGIAGALAVVGALLGNKVKIVAWGDIYHANEYFLLVGPTGTSYKSSVLSWVRRCLSHIAPELMAPQTGSPEGLLDFLADQPSAIWIRDEISGLLAAIRGKDYMRDMRGIMLELYRWEGVYRRALARKRFYESHDPALSLFATVQPEMMSEELTSEANIRAGLVNRMLFFYGDHVPIWPGISDINEFWDTIQPWLKMLAGQGIRYLDARPWQDELTNNAPALGEWGMAVAQRRPTHILKIAAILQSAADVVQPRTSLDGTWLPLEREYVEQATCIVDNCLSMAAGLLEHYAVRDEHEYLLRKMRGFFTSEPTTAGEASDKFQLGIRRVKAYLETLIERGWVEEVPDMEPKHYRAIAREEEL